ncbi:MAG: RNA-binding S4 domain-containing protein [Bacilli bacterium]|nr:RNA-binding S4 domain-containing protein [Bacilli bacterium]
MRLDLLLKQSGLIKRRTIAKEFCLKGLVFINGKKQKPSYEVKNDDVMEIIFGERVITVSISLEKQGKKTLITLSEVSNFKSGESDA